MGTFVETDDLWDIRSKEFLQAQQSNQEKSEKSKRTLRTSFKTLKTIDSRKQKLL